MSTAETLEELNKEAYTHELSDHVAQENIRQYLLAEGGEAKFTGMSPSLKATIMGATLEFYLDKLQPTKEHDIDQIIDFFENKNWIPKTKQEAADALPRGLDQNLLRVPGTPRRQKTKETAYLIAQGRFRDAEADLKAFGDIGVHMGESKDRAKAHWLRRDRRGQYLIADMLMARDFLRKGAWPDQDSLDYHKSQSYWRGFMLMAAEHAPDYALSDALNTFYPKAMARYNHMSRQYSAAGHRLGRPLTNSAAVVQLPAKHRQIEVRSGPWSVQDYIPAADKAHMDKRLAERAAMVERMDQMGMPEAEKQRRIDQAFPEFVPPEEQMRREQIAEFKARGISPPTTRHRTNPALSPSVRSRPGYDKRPDK